MAEETDEKLDQILGHLVNQGAALGTISKRLDTIEAQVKLTNEQAIRIGKRQADLEDHYATQAGSCSGMMTRLADRITALEHMVTPIPRPFGDPDPDGTGRKAMSYVLATDEPQENGNGNGNGDGFTRVPLTAGNVARDLAENVTVNWPGVAMAGLALGGVGLFYYAFFSESGREKVNSYMRELALRD